MISVSRMQTLVDVTRKWKRYPCDSWTRILVEVARDYPCTIKRTSTCKLPLSLKYLLSTLGTYCTAQ